MKLKSYQAATLRVLSKYLADARIEGAQLVYERTIAEPEMAARVGAFANGYRSLDALPDAPYVCLRLPTGGGKTILASHAVKVAKDNWVEKDFPLVLWLVPTKTIRQQTVDALKDPRHAYRAVLDEAFDGRVRVFDIADFAQLRPHDIASNCCVVVGTIQSLRVSNTEGRKVYAHHEELEPHFTKVSSKSGDFEKLDDGQVKFSFANLMHMHRPIMIVDEAHQAVTDLTRDMQQRVNPSAIIEFSATPRFNSNILYSVSAQELKDEEMIKLPVMLAEHDTWRQAVSAAISKRAELAAHAESDADYIRPIVLFQAQKKNEEVTVDVLLKHLLETENIPEEKIVVATGEQRGLDGVDLFDPACPIEYVITIEALKEGWDCSFAYVFCSVANIQNQTAVEQLLGRVLRMPYAKRRKSDPLNRAYANLTSKTFSEAATALKDKLVSMGFDETEAEDQILPEQQELDTGLFGRARRPAPSVRIPVSLSDEETVSLANVAPSKISVLSVKDGSQQVVVTRVPTPDEMRKFRSELPSEVAQKVEEAIEAFKAENPRDVSPSENGETLAVPGLAVPIQGELLLAEIDVFEEDHDWSLSRHSHQLSKTEFDLSRSTAHTFEIDIDGKRVYVTPSSETQMALGVDVEGWTEEALVGFLDRQLRHPKIGQGDLIRWLSDAVRHLVRDRGIALSHLMECKYILARKLSEKLDGILRAERESLYQATLFGPDAAPELTYEEFVFKDGVFDDVRFHRGGSYRFARHFTGWDRVPAFDGKKGDKGEELECAKHIDSLPGVEYWLRNVSRHPDAFFLPLAHNRFYPDFIAKLSDGRTLVAEYKGKHIATSDDTAEKRKIGDLWERKSEGKALFIMVEKSVDGQDMRQQLQNKIEGR